MERIWEEFGKNLESTWEELERNWASSVARNKIKKGKMKNSVTWILVESRRTFGRSKEHNLCLFSWKVFEHKTSTQLLVVGSPCLRVCDQIWGDNFACLSLSMIFFYPPFSMPFSPPPLFLAFFLPTFLPLFLPSSRQFFLSPLSLCPSSFFSLSLSLSRSPTSPSLPCTRVSWVPFVLLAFFPLFYSSFCFKIDHFPFKT